MHRIEAPFFVATPPAVAAVRGHLSSIENIRHPDWQQPSSDQLMALGPRRQHLVDQLLDEGVTDDELFIIASGRDLAHGGELLSEQMLSDRSEASLFCVTWIGGTLAFIVADLVVVASIHDAVYPVVDWVAVAALAMGALFSGITARNYFLEGRSIMRRLAMIRRILARWSR